MWNLFFFNAIGGHWAGCMFLYMSLVELEKRVDYANGKIGVVPQSQQIPPTWIELDGLVELRETLDENTNSTLTSSVLLQSRFNFKTARGRDIFKVDSTKARGDHLNGADNLFSIL